MTFNIRDAIPSDVERIARVHVDSWRTTYRGIVSDSYLASLSYEERERRWKEQIESKDHFTFVAEEEDETTYQIVGFASGGQERTKSRDYTSELYAIYLLEDYRGKGIGRRLVQRLVKKLVKEGHNSMLVWVLARNPYRNFYEKLGGHFFNSKMIEIGGENFEEVAYGWNSLNLLINQP